MENLVEQYRDTRNTAIHKTVGDHKALHGQYCQAGTK